MTNVIKKNGDTEEFDLKRVRKGIRSAMKTGSGEYFPRLVDAISSEIKDYVKDKETITGTEIDKIVVGRLKDYGQHATASNYERFKTLKYYKKSKGIVDNEIEGLLNGTNKGVIDENSNKDAKLISTQRDLIAGIESRSYSERKLIPINLLQAHREGLIHFHDTDYLIHPIFNCCLINIKDMLQNGTVINGKKIDKPHSIQTAATIATQISLQIANGQYGGQTISLSHLAPFVRTSFEKYTNKLREGFIKLGKTPDEDYIKLEAKKLTRDEVKSAVQTIQFQENTFSSNNGQTPFVSIFMYINEEPEYKEETAMLIEETIKLRYLGMKNKEGVYVTPAFPKLLYVLDENNVPQDSEYRWLTDLAVKCAAKRMNPDFISAKIMKKNYQNNVFPCMGCRSFLSPWKDENGNYKFYGRFNRGVVTLNLVDVALSARKNEAKFWEILDERLELCKEALQLRTKLLRKATPETSPIHWENGGISRLKPTDSLDTLFDSGYSSISLGYIGLHEMCVAMFEESLTSEKGSEFALKVMNYLSNKCDSWKQEEGLAGCSLYGTPSESLTYKFAQKTQKRFGKIKGVTDKDYFTNSYHINVTEKIDAFSKLKFESTYQNISKGGAVSYIEIPNMQDNLEALGQIVDFMYDNIQYAEVNTRCGDVCAECGYEGEIITDENGVWTCPNCGCQDRDKLTVIRRTCGYIGSTFWNKGKTEEINERVYHI
jgi:ribonucleoside-triphosphate reductase